jgi:uncharacterized protein (TIGR00251 family)
MPLITIQIKVKPNSRASLLEQSADGTWLAKVKSPPADGKANAEVIALVARHFKCHKANVSIKTGGSGRTKLVQIETEDFRR